MEKLEPNVQLQFLQGAYYVQKLLEVADRARLALPDSDPLKQELVEVLAPFESCVAVATYNLDEMSEQAPGGDGVSAEVAGRALELLAADYPHPWDEFTPFVRKAQEQIDAEMRAVEQPQRPA